MNRSTVVMFEEEEFEKYKDILYNVVAGRVELPEDEGIAFAITIKGESMVLVNETIYNKMDKDEKDIIILHELAHCEGITGEEDADRYVIDMLGESSVDRTEAIETLIDMWPYRHGHEYWEGK